MNTDQSTSPNSIQAGLSLRAHPGASAVPRPRSSVLRCALFIGFLSVVCSPATAQNQTINGNLTVTGTIGSAGAIDSDANTFSFGTQGGSYGAALLYQDNSTDTFTFSANRNPASWLWLHTTAIAAMRLDASHQLILYKSDGTSAGVTLMPANNAIKLGTHASGTLTADANGLITVAGGFSVAGGLTNTSGSFIGGASGLTFNAGGTNQSITLNSSGGDLIFSANAAERMRIKAAGNVGIGTATPADKLHINGNLYADMGEGFRLFGDVNYFGTALDGIVFEMRDGNSTGGATDGGFVFRGYTPTDSVAQNWMVIKTPGLVGIGTLNPGTDLDLQRSAFAQARIYSTAADSIAALQIRNDAQIWQLKTDGADADKFKLVNGGGNVAISVTPTINVGIGTTVPGEKLQVKGNLAFESANTSVFRIVPEPTTNDRILQFENGSSAATGGFAFKATDAGFNAVRLKINNNGNVGIGTTAPQASLDVAGRTLKLSNLQPEYRLDFGGGQDLNWKTIANVNLGTGTYVGANFIVQVFDADNNFGILTSAKSLTYYVAMTRSGPVQDDTDNAKVSGPLNEYVRIAKVATGTYELQVRQPADWKKMIVTARAYAINSLGSGGAINYVTTPVNGATTGAIYTPTTGHMDYMTNGYFAGNVGIGTTTPTHKLAVNGTIRAKEVIVDTGWADYVFEDDYRLAPLAEVEQHIREKKHLPGIPSAAEVAEHGVSMGEMQTRMMAKIEELTLHLIRMEKENAALRERVQALETTSTTP